jgi:rhodanese-related sulfurtransferase/uncharacterized membrane protein YphA (DoxX/SURF4 family)
MTSPMAINLEFANHLFNKKLATFIDARDSEDYNLGHIKNALNIPYDYYEDYEETINTLDDTSTYVIYCSGAECSLSMDLADYFFNELIFEKVLIFEGGWPQWKDANLPFSQNKMSDTLTIKKDSAFSVDNIISWLTFISSLIILFHFFSIKSPHLIKFNSLNQIHIAILPRFVLGIVFIFASYHKILDPSSFSDNIHNFHITPAFVENLAALIIPWLELILGVFLILGLFLEGSISITIGLYIFFIFILSQALYRGIDVHCGCFKSDGELSAISLRINLIKRIIEDFLLIGMAFICKQNTKKSNEE